jgi:GDP-L-fucose synthase
MSTILVTGGSGMIGRAIKDLTIDDKNNWIFLSSKDGDLRDINQVINIFEKHKPNYIIHLAANVGGLYMHIRERVSIFRDNVRMNENILEVCHKYNVQKGIFCLSSCIYPPKPSKFPMDETMIHEGPPHITNEGYAHAKRMLEMQCRNFNDQHKRDYICLIPVNLYGPYDNFNLEDSHVIPGLIHRFYNAIKNGDNKFEMYGTGKPLRQFLYSFDFAKIIIKTLFEYKDNKPMICCNDELPIKDVVYKIAKKINYKGEILNDLTKSDGCMVKTVTNNRLLKLFPEFKFTSLDDGLDTTVDWFIKNYDNCRK